MIGRQTLSEAMRNTIKERIDAWRSLLLDERGFTTDLPAMTVEKAVEILNARKHRDWTDWKTSKPYVIGVDGSIAYTHFDAIAIAEKYERDAVSR